MVDQSSILSFSCFFEVKHFEILVFTWSAYVQVRLGRKNCVFLCVLPQKTRNKCFRNWLRTDKTYCIFILKYFFFDASGVNYYIVTLTEMETSLYY